MPFRIYLRDDQQRVTEKTVTGSPEAARAAFKALTDRSDLDGQRLLAVLNRDGRPVAHHSFAEPRDPAKWWRDRTAEIDLTFASGDATR